MTFIQFKNARFVIFLGSDNGRRRPSTYTYTINIGVVLQNGIGPNLVRRCPPGSFIKETLSIINVYLYSLVLCNKDTVDICSK